MSKEVIQVVKFHDDLDQHLHGKDTEATRTITVAFEGKAVELDVSDANYTMVHDFMLPLLASGRKITASKNSQPRMRASYTIDPESVKYKKELREWVKANNIRNLNDTGWAYETMTGTHKTYYPEWLHKKYKAYLEEQAKAEVA